MKRHDTVRIFRQRLREAMGDAELNRSQLALKAGIDRSTLSQLLSSDLARLPRADTVAAIATVLGVSLDWLLGLSGESARSAAILNESVQISPEPQSGADSNLARWHEEAVGYKIRYVPASLPDLMKTDQVMRYEYQLFASKTPDQAIAASQGKLAYSKLPESDMEICLSQQALEGFARGEMLWRDLSAAARREQLAQIGRLAEELYPSLRIYLFDLRTNYSVPYTVFGPLRAVIYLGQIYLVFNTTDHVRVLTRHFDELIRAASVQCTDIAPHMARLMSLCQD